MQAVETLSQSVITISMINVTAQDNNREVNSSFCKILIENKGSPNFYPISIRYLCFKMAFKKKLKAYFTSPACNHSS